MVEAYKKYFTNYANFKGRSTRGDYWWVILANFLISFLIGFIGGLIPSLASVMSTVSMIYSLVTLVPGLALFTRRMHDINKSGWSWAFSLIPFVGWVVVIVFLCTASVNENNKYGEVV